MRKKETEDLTLEEYLGFNYFLDGFLEIIEEIREEKGGDLMIGRGRPTLITNCEGCGEKETKCWRFAKQWLCEFCLNLTEETL